MNFHTDLVTFALLHTSIAHGDQVSALSFVLACYDAVTGGHVWSATVANPAKFSVDCEDIRHGEVIDFIQLLGLSDIASRYLD